MSVYSWRHVGTVVVIECKQGFVVGDDCKVRKSIEIYVVSFDCKFNGCTLSLSGHIVILARW